MEILQSLRTRLGPVTEELLEFLWANKLKWMIPMIIILLLLSGLVILSETTAAGPFIYTLF